MKKLTNRASIPELLKDMSLDEKLTLLTGRSAFLAGGCPERDIPNPLFLDGGTGFNTMQMEIEASYRVIEEKNGAVDPESITSPMAGLTLGMAPGAVREDGAEPTEEEKKTAARIAEILDETRPADRRLLPLLRRSPRRAASLSGIETPIAAARTPCFGRCQSARAIRFQPFPSGCVPPPTAPFSAAPAFPCG